MPKTDNIFGEIIDTYSRAQAIEDGEVVDVSHAAKEVGIRFPCAMTRAAYAECVSWSQDDKARKPGTGQDARGRLHDVVFMLRQAVRTSHGRRVSFTVLRVPRQGRGERPQSVQLIGICGPGDNAEPVITISLPSED